MTDKERRVGKKSLCRGELFQRRADAWRERLSKRLGGKSQRRFAEAIKQRYRTIGSDMNCDQKNVSDWLHVGDEGEVKAFPPYETMIQIAEELNVSVGYLTGETDGETFDAARASDYLGLSVEATEALRKLTYGPGSSFGYKYGPDKYAVELLNDILTSEGLYDLLARMRDFALLRESFERRKKKIEKASSRYSEQLLEMAWFVVKDSRLPPLSFVEGTDEEYWQAYKDVLLEAGITYGILRGVLVVASQLDIAIDRMDDEALENDVRDTAYRYQLQMLFGNLLTETFPLQQQA